jgi:hypothetical protein
MAATLTPEDVVRRIAAECTYVDERGAVGIRLEPAAAIVPRYGEQIRRGGVSGNHARLNRHRCCEPDHRAKGAQFLHLTLRHVSL